MPFLRLLHDFFLHFWRDEQTSGGFVLLAILIVFLLLFAVDGR